MSKALIVVDLQNDFFPDGAIPVPEGDQIIPIINDLIPRFDIVVYTRDWHPENHVSFSAWPTHCIANTRGADFHPELAFTLNTIVIDKGTDPERPAHSGFEGTNLARSLKKLGVEDLYITGLITEYSVKATALDAMKEGFRVVLITDATKGLDQPAGSNSQAISEMENAGIKPLTAAEV